MSPASYTNICCVGTVTFDCTIFAALFCSFVLFSSHRQCVSGSQGDGSVSLNVPVSSLPLCAVLSPREDSGWRAFPPSITFKRCSITRKQRDTTEKEQSQASAIIALERVKERLGVFENKPISVVFLLLALMLTRPADTLPLTHDLGLSNVLGVCVIKYIGTF